MKVTVVRFYWSFLSNETREGRGTETSVICINYARVPFHVGMHQSASAA